MNNNGNNLKGLNKILKEGCYIIVYRNANGVCYADIERINKKNDETVLVIRTESRYALGALLEASSKITGEEFKAGLFPTYLDVALAKGYSLRINKLSDCQVLTSICKGKTTPKPLLSDFSSRVEEGLNAINKMLVNVEELSKTIPVMKLLEGARNLEDFDFPYDEYEPTKRLMKLK